MDASTKIEHLEWAKRRAMFYVNQKNLSSAFASMMSDLGKHEGTKWMLQTKHAAAGIAAVKKGQEAVRQWVDGFMFPESPVPLEEEPHASE
jgi:hypothetical protein